VLRLLILGGGMSGLAAAFYARRAGLSPQVFESASVAGGNARTLTRQGFRYDTGAHRLHDKDAGVTTDLASLLGDDLRSVSAPSRILRDGRFVDFPLAPANLVRALGPLRTAQATRDFLQARWGSRELSDGSFESTVVARYGRTIASLFVLEYSEKLWGVPARTLSPAVGGKRLEGLTLRALFREAFGRHGARQHLDGAFLYPRRGIGQIADALIGAIGRDAVMTESRITRIGWAGSRIRSVEVEGVAHEVTGPVISTLPLSIMVRLLDPAPPAHVLAAASCLQFRDVRLVTVLLARERVTANATVYFPEERFPFTRVTEPRNRSVDMAPPGCTSLVAEVPCWAHERFSAADDAELADVCVERLGEIGWLAKGDVLEVVVDRLRHAYPVIDTGAEAALEPVHAWLARFDNLRRAGRAGRFAYTHIHDLMREGREVAQECRTVADTVTVLSKAS
jgi:protoporphyrinogen oxidase